MLAHVYFECDLIVIPVVLCYSACRDFPILSLIDDERVEDWFPSMHNTYIRELQVYKMPNGREPFTDWFESIRDQRIQDRIQSRLDLIALGNLGDRKSVGAGVYELRFHFGAGYRVYYGEIGNTIVLLLCGGDKSSQRQDIQRAKSYWDQYKESQQ